MATTGTTRGLNAAKIGMMQSALQNYIDAVNNKIKIGATSQKIKNAIKGSSSEKSLITMNNEITNKLKNLTAQLNQYSNTFTMMKESYQKHDTDNTVFNNVAKDLNKQ